MIDIRFVTTPGAKLLLRKRLPQVPALEGWTIYLDGVKYTPYHCHWDPDAMNDDSDMSVWVFLKEENPYYTEEK